MKGKVVSFSILTLLVMLVAVLAMASSAKACIIVPASNVATGPPYVYTITSVTTLPSGIVIVKFDFAIPNLLTIGTKGYDTDSIATGTFVFDPHTNVAHIFWDGSLHVIGSPTNGFSYYPWSFVVTEYGYDLSTDTYTFVTVQCVAFGFGSFAGDTLVLHYAGTNALTGTWTGFVVKP